MAGLLPRNPQDWGWRWIGRGSLVIHLNTPACPCSIERTVHLQIGEGGPSFRADRRLCAPFLPFRRSAPLARSSRSAKRTAKTELGQKWTGGFRAAKSRKQPLPAPCKPMLLNGSGAQQRQGRSGPVVIFTSGWISRGLSLLAQMLGRRQQPVPERLDFGCVAPRLGINKVVAKAVTGQNIEGLDQPPAG